MRHYMLDFPEICNLKSAKNSTAHVTSCIVMNYVNLCSYNRVVRKPRFPHPLPRKNRECAVMWHIQRDWGENREVLKQVQYL
jgi:hypothetical protein